MYIFPFLLGYQSYWIKIYPNDPILITVLIKIHFFQKKKSYSEALVMKTWGGNSTHSIFFLALAPVSISQSHLGHKMSRVTTHLLFHTYSGSTHCLVADLFNYYSLNDYYVITLGMIQKTKMKWLLPMSKQIIV